MFLFYKLKKVHFRKVENKISFFDLDLGEYTMTAGSLSLSILQEFNIKCHLISSIDQSRLPD